MQSPEAYYDAFHAKSVQRYCFFMKLPNIFAKKCKKVEKTAFYLYKSKNSSNFAG